MNYTPSQLNYGIQETGFARSTSSGTLKKSFKAPVDENLNQNVKETQLRARKNFYVKENCLEIERIPVEQDYSKKTLAIEDRNRQHLHSGGNFDLGKKKSFLCFQSISEDNSEMVNYEVNPVERELSASQHFITNNSNTNYNRFSGIGQFTFGDLGELSESRKSAIKDSNSKKFIQSSQNSCNHVNDQMSNIVGVLTNLNATLNKFVTKANSNSVNENGYCSSCNVEKKPNRISPVNTQKLSLEGKSTSEAPRSKTSKMSCYKDLLKDLNHLSKTEKPDLRNLNNYKNADLLRRGGTLDGSLKKTHSEFFKELKDKKFDSKNVLHNSKKVEVENGASNAQRNSMPNKQEIRKRNFSETFSNMKHYSNQITKMNGKKNFDEIVSPISKLLKSNNYGTSVNFFSRKKVPSEIIDSSSSKPFVNLKSELYLVNRPGSPVEDILLQKGLITKKKIEDLRNTLKAPYQPSLVAKQQIKKSSEKVPVFDRLHNRCKSLNTLHNDKNFQKQQARKSSTKPRSLSSVAFDFKTDISGKQRDANSYNGKSTNNTFKTKPDLKDYYLDQLNINTLPAKFTIETFTTPTDSKTLFRKSQRQSKENQNKFPLFSQTEQSPKSRNSPIAKEFKKNHPGDFDRLYKDLKKWICRRDNKIDSLARQADENQTKECTFHPKIIKMKKTKVRTSSELSDVPFLNSGHNYELFSQSNEDFLKIMSGNNLILQSPSSRLK